METIELATTGRTTTRLGYGCSSLMSALGRRESLALLETAYDAGIRHFDVAPMYGYGAAEGCVGEFLAGHKDATVTTKYGIPPAKNPGLIRTARRMLRPVLERIPALKKKLMRAASVAAPAEKSSFTAVEARASIENSLRQLRVDRIDVWLMHEAEACDLHDAELLRFCEGALASGKIGAFGVGSEARLIPALQAERPEFCSVLQYEWSVADATIRTTEAFRIHHRALAESYLRLRDELKADSKLCARWSQDVGVDLREGEALAHLMLKAALVENPDSVILVSSKKKAHIAANVRVACDAGLAAAARRMHVLLQVGTTSNEAVAV